MKQIVRAALCALGGTILFLSGPTRPIPVQPGHFDPLFLAGWVGLVPILFAVLDEDCDRPFFYGWIGGLFANGGGFYWINHLLVRFGHMPWFAALPIYLLLVAYQAITFGLFAWALRRLRAHLDLPVTLLAPIVMTALELVVPFLFPWYLAITQAWQRPVIQIADMTGPLGVTFLLVLANGALYDLAHARLRRQKLPWRRAAMAAGVIALALIYGQIRIRQVEARRAAAEKVKVGVVQANIGITEKFVPGLREQQLAVHQRLSADLERRGAKLVVWPESSYPYYFRRGQAHDWADDKRVQQGFSTPVLFGAITFGGDSPYPFNTALMMDGHGNVTGTFDKNFLLVFGEYIPFYEHARWVQKLIPEASNFARGDSVTAFPLGRWRLGPMICYEDIIPSFGNRLGALDPSPNLLVNITNDAWFGATSEPWEHMALSVYRAVEHRLDLVRAVNTGVSAFIDATGRVVDRGPAVDPEDQPDAKPVTLLDEAAMLQAGGLYGTIGDSFGGLNLLALLGLGAWARKRSGKPVRWRAVGEGAAVLAVGVLGSAAIAGRSHFGLALSLIAHRPTSPADAADAFSSGMWLLLLGAAATVAMGAVLARRTGGRPRLEACVAAVATLLGPALVMGRIEGETAALVFTALGGAGAALLGVRLGAQKAAVVLAATDQSTPSDEKPKKRRAKR